ncbi:glycosyltransferase family 2 protein [Rheinheimera maricola]|uniref:Glycosyltransferase n=1 Tax=Rheinheimera maricola TaxID=2793282 RepID=A0ABS7X436_9GAMM|nr:glycosyltransferase family 2 protein [Rheinheimera maricola]MBZ9610315.1 glycosyltransferase [Rheinheimera maricola]
MPKISVVTVLFNALEDFKLTEKSVLSQNYNNLEYVIVDGNSTDGSKEYCSSRTQYYDVFISEPDTGIYNAMNKAVRYSSGDYVIFLNAGDEFSSPTILSEIFSTLDYSEDIIYGDRYRTEVNGIRTLEKAGNLENIFYTEVIYHQAVFNKRSILLDKPYDESLRLAADYKFMLDIYVSGASFRYVPLAVCDFKSGGRSRQQYLLGATEAARASFNHLNDKNEWKKTQFIKSISLNNCEYYLNSAIEDITTNMNVNGREINKTLSISNFDSDSFTKGVLYRLLCNLEQRGYLKSKTSYPKISILTVVYNDKIGLLRTIESVKSLKYPNIEFIVIDGDSKDGTKEVIGRNSSIIDIAISEQDNGIYDAMNKAIDLASGYYCVFMNAGDEFASKDVLNNIFLCPDFDDEFDIIYGNREYITEDQVTLQKANLADTINVRMPFCHQAVFTKTSVLLKNKFDTSFRSAADYNQFVKLYKAGAKFKFMDTLVCKFYAGGTSEGGLIPYMETIKIQIDNFGLEDVQKNSFYYSAFKRNINRILGAD